MEVPSRPPSLAETIEDLERRVTELEQQSRYTAAILEEARVINSAALHQFGGEPLVSDEELQLDEWPGQEDAA